MILNPPETNYRAVRDMGLAAWFGGSLIHAIGTHAAGEAIDDPKERIRVVNEAWDKSLPVYGGAIASYLIGTQLVRDGMKNGRPAVVEEGVQDPISSAVAGLAVAAGVTQRALRTRIQKTEEEPHSPETSDPEAHRRHQKALNTLQWLVPALTGWLLFRNIKQDLQEHRAWKPTRGWRRLIGR